MIPRRVYEHVKTHNWFAVAIDFVIVVVGVFVGLQVNNWNAARVEKLAARTYIERIREDLRENQRDLERRNAYYAQVKSHALAALAAFDKPSETLGEQFLIDAYQASQIISRVVDRSTYNEILSVGAMNSIPNLAVRRRIANFYQNAEAIEAILNYVPVYRENLRRRMPYPVQEAMLAYCDDISVTDERGAPSNSLPEECDLNLAPAAIAEAVAELLDPELRRDLVRRIADLDTKRINNRRLIDRAQALDKILAEAKI
jgi:hypothetical protein